MPHDAARASVPESDDKARFTAMLCGHASGDMAPSFNIVKCNSTKPDLSGTWVLNNLVNNGSGFKIVDGWKLMSWTRSLALKNKKGELETKIYKRPFLLHNNGTVITLQAKAWMDSVGIAMWCDTLLGPHVRAQCGGKAALIWDNCGSHNSDAVQEVFRLWGIKLLNLPPKMTDQLQVMDLVVNAPLKAGIRRDRIQNMFTYFQTWKFERLQDQLLPADQQKRPPFNPPKPTLRDGLLSLFRTLTTTLATNKFQAALARCFIEACQAPREDGSFVTYTNHRRGSVVKAAMAGVTSPVNDNSCSIVSC